jgi:hypothetical protein
MNSALSSSREEYVQWFIEIPFSFCVTHTFRQSTKSIQSVERYLKKLNHTLRRRAFGKHALSKDKFNNSEFISMVAMIQECVDGSFHVHALITHPPKILKPKNEFSLAKSVIMEWQKITGSSDNKIDPLLAKSDIRYTSFYMLKTYKQYPERLNLFCWDA